MSEPLIIERRDSVLLIQLNRPEMRNALSAAMKAELEQIIPALAEDKLVRALVITGTGTAFCAGSDLGSWKERSPAHTRDRVKQSHEWINLLAHWDIPIVTAVNGIALGAGLGLALLGDVIIAADDACFQAGFPRVGAVADYGTAFTLPRIIGINRAKEMLLLNRAVEAEEALAIGLVSRVVPTERLREEALAVADSLSKGPTLSMGLTKMLLRAAYDRSVDEFLESEAMAQAVAIASADFDEGVKAFLGRRSPVFIGK